MKAISLIIITSLLKCGLQLQMDEMRHYKPSEAFLVENSLQPSEQDVPLEEFFWTGSGDGPPYLKPKDSSGHDVKYPNTIVRTATILATVYIDGNYDLDFDPLCVYDCDRKNDDRGVVESFENIPPKDRRYWLLTVVAGLFNSDDFPILEEKLAKLYRIAFLRQQANHLGIANGKNSTTNGTLSERRKRSTGSVIITPTRTFNGTEKIQTRRFEINRHVYERQVLRMKRQRTPSKPEAQPTSPPITLNLPYDVIYQTTEKSKKLQTAPRSRNFLQKVSVVILNATHGEDDKESFDSNRIDLAKDKINQTEIIYTVIVDGKPVLASTAAQDMKLVRDEEAAKIMEKGIVLKAEPYLREPQATPLAPSYDGMNGSNTVTSYVNQNPLLIALSVIALILLILLLITLLLYGRSKRRLAIESKRHSASQALVQKSKVDDDIATIRSDSLESVGVDNLAFEKEFNEKKKKKEPPVLHFPLPPANRPPSTDSSSTSDSSVYYPKRRFKLNSMQDLLESKDDELYSKIQSTEKGVKKDGKVNKQHRNRRKYRADNRVGSIEQIDVHSLQADSFNDELAQFQEHNEAFNPHVSHYNSNKVMTNKAFSLIESERRKVESRATAEAINKELIQQRGRIKSADSNSIGSFLSMASIKSFPKCSVPEPLSRVLEPVSVTHYDHSDADRDTLKNYRMMDSQKSLNFDDMQEEFQREAQAQSDSGADPGVVGPIIWEMHKKGFDLSTNSLSSPLRDPHSTRNRFEGLLEGAMKLYGSSSYSNCHSLMNQQDDMPGAIKTKEARGKSAATIRLTSRTSGLLSRTDFHPPRPMTAGPDVQPAPNPVPTIRAWTSGSGSLVRPLSAGIYHKPKLSPEDERAKVDRTRAMSASPIIDAIQKELKRISNED